MSRSRAMLLGWKKTNTAVKHDETNEEYSLEEVKEKKEKIATAKTKLKVATRLVGAAAIAQDAGQQIEQVKNEEESSSSFSHGLKGQQQRKRRHSSFADMIVYDYRSQEAVDRFWRSAFMSREEQQRLSIGELEVRIIEAVHLPAADFGGLSDPYIVARLTGRNTWNQFWFREQRWRTRTIKKNLNPQFYESTNFRVPRFDAILRLEVYDADENSKDDFLGYVEIKIAQLHGLGALKRWWPLKVNPKYLKKSVTTTTAAAAATTKDTAAVHLNLKYDCSKLGEAMSLLWLPEARRKAHKSFDVNDFIHNTKLFQHELKPYLHFFEAVDDILTWKFPRLTLLCLLLSVLFVILCIQKLFVVLHEVFALALVINGIKLARLSQIRAQADRIFKAIDTDNSNSLDRKEIGIALQELTTCLNGTEVNAKTIDALFLRHDKDKSGHLEFEEFFELLVDCPEIVGSMVAAFSSGTTTAPPDESYDDPKVIPATRQEDSTLQEEGDFDEESDPYHLDEIHDDDSSVLSSLPDTSKNEFTTEPSLKKYKMRFPFKSFTPSTMMSTQLTLRPSDDDLSTTTPDLVETTDGKQIKGASRVVANMVGRRLGPTATLVLTQLGDRAKDLLFLRELFAWVDPQLSTGAIVGNLVMAWIHAKIDSRFIWSIFTILFYLQRTHLIQAFIRIGSIGPSALQRYLSSEEKLRAKARKLLAEADSTLPLKRHQTAASLIRRTNVKSVQMRALGLVLQSIFSHLDADGSGTVDANELCNFVLKALRNATRAAKARAGLIMPDTNSEDDPQADYNRVHEILDFASLDANGDGIIDYTEFTEVVAKSGCAEILMQDELHRQLVSHAGFKCVKWPTHRTIGSTLATHSTCLNLHRRRDRQGYDLSYTNRRGLRLDIMRDDLQDVVNSVSSDHIIEIRYSLTSTHGSERSSLTTPRSSSFMSRLRSSVSSIDNLKVSVAPILRDPLRDLLRARLMDAEMPLAHRPIAKIGDLESRPSASLQRQSSSMRSLDLPTTTFPDDTVPRTLPLPSSEVPSDLIEFSILDNDDELRFSHLPSHA